MSEISVSVVGSTTINPTVGNGDTVNVTITETGARGPTGATGPANTLSIGTVAAGTTASATITGTSPTQTLSLVLPKGDTGSAGSTGSTGAAGSTGPAGPANTLTIGTVASGTAAATITGTSPNQVLNLVLQKGDTGAAGATGATGATGPAGSIPLADETPRPLGVASAGSATTAARADHVHATPTIAYSSLSGVPSTFSPVAHSHTVSDVTGLQTALDSKQASGTYATLVGGTVPSSQLPSYVDDVVEVAGYSSLPATGESGKLYVALDTKKLWRWSGSGYVEISPSPGSTDSVTEGSTNLYFTDARAVSALSSSLSGKASTSHTHTASQITDFASAVSAVGVTVPVATKSVVGGVSVGGGLSVTGGGALSVEAAPGAPTSITDSGGTLSWTASTTGTSAAYDVQQTNDSGATYTTFVSGVTGTSTANFDSSRKFRIRARNAAGLYGTWGYQSGLTAQVEARNLTIGSGFTTTDGTLSVSAGSSGVTSVAGRSGAVTLTSSDVGLSAVNNTSDASKPVSTLQAAADAAVQAYAIQRANHTGSQAASTITGLATVATSGSYADITGTPAAYSLPVATASVLGGVKQGTNITIAADGTISAASGGGSYTLPAATASTLGGIIVGSGLSIASGVLSATGGGGSGLTWSSVPASPTSSGTAGSIAYDGSYFYVASATNTWVRAAVSTWTVPVITISSQPSAQTASSGAATFSVTASVSSGSVTYQWQRQALGTGSYANVSGATSATLSLTGLTNSANNADNYRVVVSATGALSVTSSSAALTVASGSLLTIARNNGTSTFTGSGTTGSPFTRNAGVNHDEADGLSRYSWTATGAATVTVRYDFADDDGNDDPSYIKKNGTIVHTVMSAQSIVRTVSVVSGDVITIGVQQTDGSQYFSLVSVSAA